jgi:PKD repeat protein
MKNVQFFRQVAGILSVAQLCAALSASAASRPRLAVTGSGQTFSGSAPFQLQLYGDPSQYYVIQAGTDLVNWTAISTNRTDSMGVVRLSDPQWQQYPRRYYRAMLQPGSILLGGAGYRQDRILVKPMPGADLSGLHLLLGTSLLQSFQAIGNLQILRLPAGTTVSAAISAYLQSGLVVYAEPDYMVQALLVPNDFRYNDGTLWGLHNTGLYGGIPGADIDAPDAWDIQHTASSVIVAVVDTGVRYTHEDLAANMWVNPADGSHGLNLVTNGLAANDPNDDNGHGTHVAGTIGAVGNNSVGVVGVSWSVQIMACKFLDKVGNGTISDAITCFDFARTHGARVVNASWGSPTFTSQALHDSIASLRQAGIVFIGAAGNSAANNDVTPLYPASYSDLDNVVAVAATERTDAMPSWSDYGPTNVALAAPGAAIFSCWDGSDSDYQYDDGTSMAAAHVSGACAILMGHFPNDSYQQTIGRLLSNVVPLPSLAGKCRTGGRLNLYKALTGGSPPPTLAANFTANPTSGQAPLTVQFTDQSTGVITAWDWDFGDGSAHSSVQNPSHTYNSAGSFTVTLTVTGNGGATSSKSATITATAATSVSANFTANPTSGQVPLLVQFTDTSTGSITAWDWNFGDGSAHSSVQNPSHTYSSAGTFTVTLTVTGSGGATSSKAGTITATASATVTANFTANPTSGQAPLFVQFTDQSTGPVTAWDWDFGDGSAHSSVQSPSHTYNSAGTFTVTLTVTGSGGATSSKTGTITATAPPPPPIANFVANPTSGQAPLFVQFTDESTGMISAWDWNFGDGSAHSSARNPSHTYNSAGNFTVTLTVTGSGGTSSKSLTITVSAPPPPLSANFTASPTSGPAPLTVQFTDLSTGNPVAWSWNFGDLFGSTAQNPSHVFLLPGTYTVTLTVTGSDGATSSTSGTITATLF